MKVKKDRVIKNVEKRLVPDYVAAGWTIVNEDKESKNRVSRLTSNNGENE